MAVRGGTWLDQPTTEFAGSEAVNLVESWIGRGRWMPSFAGMTLRGAEQRQGEAPSGSPAPLRQSRAA